MVLRRGPLPRCSAIRINVISLESEAVVNETEMRWFEALVKDRSESAAMLAKPSMQGVQHSVVEKYSDQAHFVYELLQNGDDVKATSVSFRLENDGLYFIHNGSVRFTISDPEFEQKDTATGNLGHINSITSIANSNKQRSTSIGKFGVGFKAVFQYTQTPHIYDPGIRFRIERFIVPKLIHGDLEWRNPNETVFWFPFDHKDKAPHVCYEEILEKLKTLDFPTLFLPSLKLVEFSGQGVAGKYSKTIVDQRKYGDVVYHRVKTEFRIDNVSSVNELIVFSQKSNIGLPYCVGFALDGEGKLTPIERPAFCFFKTKEVTNLNFIIHAPFLLTDSREGIKAGEEHNRETIRALATLAAYSFILLRDLDFLDDGIFEVIPYNERLFSELNDRNKISFKPFYSEIKEKLRSHALLPAANRKCAKREQAYWASDRELVDLFSEQQLEQLTSTQDAKWIFRSRGKKDVLSGNRVLADYIDGGDARTWARKESNLILGSLEPESVLRRISSEFILCQPVDWLHKLYAYLSERPSYQKSVKDKPIFLDQVGRPVSAFDKDGHLILFLPDKDLDGYAMVDERLLANQETRDFVQKFGIKYPNLRDEIYNKVLPECGKAFVDASSHFQKFFRYFKECRQDEVSGFIDLIKNQSFLSYTSVEDDEVYHGKASELYFPTSDLKAWFETKPDTKFLAFDSYTEKVHEKDVAMLNLFLERLGVARKPRIYTQPAARHLVADQRLKKGGNSHTYEDKFIDGCEQIIANINADRSVLAWRIISSLDHDELKGEHRWSFYKQQYETFESSEEQRLQDEAWLLDRSGRFVSSKDLTVNSLSEHYELGTAEADSLVDLLKIRKDAPSAAHLTDEETRKIQLADAIENSGLSSEEIMSAIEEAKRRKNAFLYETVSVESEEPATVESPIIREVMTKYERVKASKSANQEVAVAAGPDPISDAEDSDIYSPRVVDFGRKVERAKDKFADELDRLEHEQLLHERATSLPRYSYGWFLALLELECLASSEKNADGKSVSISFGKVEANEQSNRTIVLKEPNRFVPPSIEELSGVRIDLDFGDGRTGKLRVESFTAKEFSLICKLESADELRLINLKEILEARIEVQNPAFLLRELLERFRELRFDEEFDMKSELTPNIEFVFGPPGTGKTTHLAEKQLIPRMTGFQNQRILVLAPTNKAADVLTKRIIEKMGDDTSYLDWLVRFGTSADEYIEKAGVWRDRSFEINALSRSVTVTTIARFAYDGFSGPNGKKLRDMGWDVIVMDEASMISLASIIYPLFRLNPQMFVIAGDPFQIEPIVAVEQWKDENIYTLVGLSKSGSFSNPSTEPHKYLVTNLEIQYRSVPDIGEVFSQFTYDGVLAHYRKEGTHRRLKIDGLELESLNLISFPVSKYESIYRSKRLESGTPYQVYSALFTFEFVRWLTLQIQCDSDSRLRIGVIAPYRAQANILHKLNDTWSTKPDSIEVQVGTIHGFQGDECDIVIVVLNPPPTISNNERMFLNKQNILNVAISRARDYLFIVKPDDETDGVANLQKISKIERLVKQNKAFTEYFSNEIEGKIWGNPKFLEENTFSTGHQMVNVYRRPEYYYEVRSDDKAIDVQVHDTVSPPSKD